MKNQDIHPSYLGWQVEWPVFVKQPFTSANRQWHKGDEYKWAELGVDERQVASLYASNHIHHNVALEKQNNSGDRLHEADAGQLKSIVILLNAEYKKRCVSNKEYQEKRCRQSRIEAKQRGLIRRWLYSNQWAQETYYDIRDKVLGGHVAKDDTPDTQDE